jgi:LemA protein
MDFGFGTILLVAIVALAGYVIVIYNGLVRARQLVKERGRASMCS